MKNETLAEYIQTSISNGVSREEIAVELLGKGWGEDAIAHAFSTTQVETRAEPHEAPAPTKVVDENEYPISTLWIFKAPIIIVVVEIILLLFGFWAPDLLLILLAALIANPLIRRNFHYQIRSTSFWVQQGVFSKKERDLPYGVIQNVLVKQDIFDRVFGLATLLVENAGNSGGKQNMQANPFFKTSSDGGLLGSLGNRIQLAGLSKRNAEIVKSIILKKMEDNPIDDQRSGL